MPNPRGVDGLVYFINDDGAQVELTISREALSNYVEVDQRNEARKD